MRLDSSLVKVKYTNFWIEYIHFRFMVKIGKSISIFNHVAVTTTIKILDCDSNEAEVYAILKALILMEFLLWEQVF